MKVSRSLLLIILVAIAWLTLVVILYYAGHKPFSPQMMLRIAVSAWQVLVCGIVLSVGGGVGKRLIRNIEINHISALACQSAAGLGLISIGILIGGALIGISAILCWAVLMILGVIFWRDIRDWWSGWKVLIPIWVESGRFGKGIGFGIVSLLLCTLIISLAPPLKFDALVYHLSLPRIYLYSGSVSYAQEIMFWGMPQVGEMLYTWVMGLAGWETSTVFGWSMGVLAIIGLLGYVADRFGLNPAWVAVASLLSGYTLTMLLPAGYIEWFTILFGVGVIVALDTWWLNDSRRALMWAGIFAGLAMGSKYTAGILMIDGIGVVFVHSWQTKRRLRDLTQNLIYFLIPATLIFLPWLVRNSLATGNPLYPFFIPAGNMDHYRLEAYQLPSWGDWKDLFLLPIRATITGFEGAPGYSATISPLLLALAPFAFIGYKSRPLKQRVAILNAGVIGGIALIVWVIASRFSGFLIQSRLYFGVFPAFAVLVGAGYSALANIQLPGVRLGRIVAIVVAMVLGFTIIQVITEFVERGSLKVLLNIESPDDYLKDNLGWYFPAAKAISELPEGSRVLLLWEPRSYYCQPNCIPDEILDRWRHARQTLGEPGDILISWREAGYTHLLYNRFGSGFIRESDSSYDETDWLALDSLLNKLGTPKDFGGAYELYSIQP